MARSTGNSSGESGKPNNYPANRRSPKGSGSAGSKGGGSGLILAVALPALALGGVVAYYGSPQFRHSVNQSAQHVGEMLQSVPDSDIVSLPEQPAEAAPQTVPSVDSKVVPFRTDQDTAAASLQPLEQPVAPSASVVEQTPPAADQAVPVTPPVPEKHAKKRSSKPKVVPADLAKKEAKTKPVTADAAKPPKTPQTTSQAPKAGQPMDLPVRAGGITLRQSQELAAKIFGGEVVRSKVSKNRDWYELAWNGGQKAAPFDVAPKQVHVATRALTGKFAAKHAGFVVFLQVADPQGPEWTETYFGAALVAGTPDNPGRVLGTTAMQAPKGRFTRREARDLDGDGTAELILEIESQAPGGYVNRDLAVHKFGRSGTHILFSAKTLEDGPGVPTAEARFKEVTFQDSNSDGIDEIVVKEGVRTFDVDETLYRTQTGQKILTTRTFKLAKGRYRIASK